jgi:SAM-dependent methyltransferase
MNSDEVWENLAKVDPYWAVVTYEEFKRENLSEETKRKFFQAGEEFIADIIGVLSQHFQAPTHFGSTLDFGCGVGRLLLPLARRSNVAIGVDVSPTMLKICSDNARLQGVQNIQLIQGDDTLSRITARVDLLTSYIVLQHVPPTRGYKLFAGLLQRLNPGGFGFIHITYASAFDSLPLNASTFFGDASKYYRRSDEDSLRVLQGAARTADSMQMYHYDLNAIMSILFDCRIVETYLRHTNHGGYLGVGIFFKSSLE